MKNEYLLTMIVAAIICIILVMSYAMGIKETIIICNDEQETCGSGCCSTGGGAPPSDTEPEEQEVPIFSGNSGSGGGGANYAWPCGEWMGAYRYCYFWTLNTGIQYNKYYKEPNPTWIPYVVEEDLKVKKLFDDKDLRGHSDPYGFGAV